LGKVSCIPQSGELEYIFNSQDHLPPHVHVVHKGGDFEIRVYFLSCKKEHLAFDFKFPPTEKTLSAKFRKDILENVLKYQAQLLKEWERKVNYKGGK
jgi:hypothetical protein